MATFLFFVGFPILFAALQFCVTRSRLSKGKKWLPPLAVGACGLICLLGMMDILPLPQTYFLDGHEFIAFPDFFYVGLFCCPALLGLGIGAALAVAEGAEKTERREPQ